MKREFIFRWSIAAHRSSTLATPAVFTFLMLVLIGCSSTIEENCQALCPAADAAQLSLPNVARVGTLDSILAGRSVEASVQGVAA